MQCISVPGGQQVVAKGMPDITGHTVRHDNRSNLLRCEKGA